MEQLLRQAELFEELSDEGLRRACAIASQRTMRAGEYLFLLGDDANDFFVVTRGNVDLCFPMPLRGQVKDIPVESVGVGNALGWSALVKPYRFTLSARATEPSELISFPRRSLLELFDSDPQTGRAFFMKISELVGIRLVTFQALWVRELQRLAERVPELQRV